MRRLIFSLCLPFMLFAAGCGAPASHESEMTTVTACSGGGIVVSGGWMRAARANQPTSAAYLSICNGEVEDDALTAVVFDGAQAVEIHQSAMNENNVATMTPLDQLALSAGQPVNLEPGGSHIMLIGITEAIMEDDDPALTLKFENAPDLTITLDVRDAHGDAHGEDHSAH